MKALLPGLFFMFTIIPVLCGFAEDQNSRHSQITQEMRKEIENIQRIFEYGVRGNSTDEILTRTSRELMNYYSNDLVYGILKMLSGDAYASNTKAVRKINSKIVKWKEKNIKINILSDNINDEKFIMSSEIIRYSMRILSDHTGISFVLVNSYSDRSIIFPNVGEITAVLSFSRREPEISWTNDLASKFTLIEYLPRSPVMVFVKRAAVKTGCTLLVSGDGQIRGAYFSSWLSEFTATRPAAVTAVVEKWRWCLSGLLLGETNHMPLDLLTLVARSVYSSGLRPGSLFSRPETRNTLQAYFDSIGLRSR